MIAEVYALLSEIESVLQTLSDARPLPGNLMRKRKYGFVHEFRSKLNKLRDQYADDRAMKALSAAKKQELLGFYPVNFRKSAKIARTRQADQDKTKRSVRLLMEAYAEPIEDDPNAALEDPIALCTQAEIFRDAAQHEELLGIFDAESSAGIRAAAGAGHGDPLHLDAHPLVQERERQGQRHAHPAGGPTGGQQLLHACPELPPAQQPRLPRRKPGGRLWLEALLRQGLCLPSWAVEDQALLDTQTQPWWRAYL